MKNKNVRMIVSLVLNLLIITAGVYIVFTVGTRAYSFGNKIFNEQAIDAVGQEREVEITITSSMSTKKIAKLLCDKGLTEDETVTYFQLKLSDYKDKIVPGTYTLTTAMKPTDMMAAMSPQEDADSESN